MTLFFQRIFINFPRHKFRISKFSIIEIVGIVMTFFIERIFFQLKYENNKAGKAMKGLKGFQGIGKAYQSLKGRERQVLHVAISLCFEYSGLVTQTNTGYLVGPHGDVHCRTLWTWLNGLYPNIMYICTYTISSSCFKRYVYLINYIEVSF